jgi:hypothetical protein
MPVGLQFRRFLLIPYGEPEIDEANCGEGGDTLFLLIFLPYGQSKRNSAKTNPHFCKKFSTAFGGQPDGGIFTSLCLVWASLRSPDAAKLGLT